MTTRAGSERGAPPDDVDAAPAVDERIRALYEQHGLPLFRFLLGLTFGNRETAEDLVQETLLRAWRHVGTLRQETVRPWLFTVARRIAIDAARAGRARPAARESVDVGDLVAPDDAIDRLLDAQTIRRVLPVLGDAHREIILELYYNGRSSRETAELLGIPEGTVRSRAHYALRALRAAIGAIDGAP